MALALMKLYNALKKDDVPEAAAEVAACENRLSTVERHLEVLQTKTNDDWWGAGIFSARGA